MEKNSVMDCERKEKGWFDPAICYTDRIGRDCTADVTQHKKGAFGLLTAKAL